MDTSHKNRKVLPVPGERNILITSALPYVNNVPHLGNIVGSVLSADVFARFCRARGYNTLYICGTDEYGTVTETKALEEKVTPQELCDKYNALHAQTYKWFNIDFDLFGRTPTAQQTFIAQDIFTKLHKNGYLEERTTTQPYCEKHEAYLADRFVEGECPLCGYLDARGDQCDQCGKLLDPLDLKNSKCKLDGAAPVPRETKHVFMLLDKLQPAIEKWVKESTVKGAWSSNGISITETWLNEGLKPRGITRDLKWGTAVPLPGYEKKVLYVWFDACIGYVSITMNYTDEWEKWWRNPEHVQLYQFMGKDNVPFHSVIFPGSQIGTGDVWTQPHHISTTEYLKYEGGKFSKSRGIGVFGSSAEATGIPSDVWRYYLLSHRPESSDSEFEWKSFIDSNNNELLKNFGNFVNRIVKFVNSPKTYASVLPASSFISSSSSNSTDPALSSWRDELNVLLQEYIADLEAVKLKAGLAVAMRISAHGNLLLQANTLDNKLFAEQGGKCADVVNLAINLVHLLASVIRPYMPSTSDLILSQLNAELLLIPDKWTGDSLKAGHKIGEAQYLFTQIKPTKEAEWRDMCGGREAQKAKEEKAAKAAARKADKEKRKLKKQQPQHSETVEAVEKEGAELLDKKEDANAANAAVDELTKGVHQAALQTS